MTCADISLPYAEYDFGEEDAKYDLGVACKELE